LSIGQDLLLLRIHIQPDTAIHNIYIFSVNNREKQQLFIIYKPSDLNIIKFYTNSNTKMSTSMKHIRYSKLYFKEVDAIEEH
jgi:hypothetical protein